MKWLAALTCNSEEKKQLHILVYGRMVSRVTDSSTAIKDEDRIVDLRILAERELEAASSLIETAAKTLCDSKIVSYKCSSIIILKTLVLFFVQRMALVIKIPSLKNRSLKVQGMYLLQPKV